MVISGVTSEFEFVKKNRCLGYIDQVICSLYCVVYMYWRWMLLNSVYGQILLYLNGKHGSNKSVLCHSLTCISITVIPEIIQIWCENWIWLSAHIVLFSSPQCKFISLFRLFVGPLHINRSSWNRWRDGIACLSRRIIDSASIWKL